MKKEWINPQIFQLGVQQTHGGPNYTEAPDGDPYYDEETNKWWVPHGES